MGCARRSFGGQEGVVVYIGSSSLLDVYNGWGVGRNKRSVIGKLGARHAVVDVWFSMDKFLKYCSL